MNVEPRLGGSRAALALLMGLNLFNYIDRYILPAVLPAIQREFHVKDSELGFLTTTFFIGYILTAPLFGWLADRYPRKIIMAAGGLLWSAATLLTAFTYDFRALVIRHVVVGIGEASFATIAPAFLADLFSEEQRGRALAFFNIALPFGAAAGYALGGILVVRYGWRAPFYLGAAPGALLALAVARLREPPRGRRDRLQATEERATLRGLMGNAAFWTAVLGMAMLTFAEGGLSQWMPVFLNRVRGVPLDRAGIVFGAITGFNGIVATLLGGWLADRMLRKAPAANYWISAAAMLLGVGPMAVALWGPASATFPAIFAGEFMLFLNTGPLNAAIVNSVSASIRARALAISIFLLHLLGDVPSPQLIGFISDKTHSLQKGFMPALAATALSGIILLYGARFAPDINTRP
ncbi:MAG: MFS transporter [Acidobacteria bacterium]|nr:MFS transporter [Acidobacteriota bacterium]